VLSHLIKFLQVVFLFLVCSKLVIVAVVVKLLFSDFFSFAFYF